MHVIEQLVCGKRPDQALCEDGMVVTPHFAAVVDGSTSKVEGRNGGLTAMRLVCEAISSLPPTADKQFVINHLTSALAEHNVAKAAWHAAYRLTCSAVVYSHERRVVWMIGDCQCRFSKHTYTNNKLVDSVVTQARCEALHYLLTHGHTVDELREKDLARGFLMDALRQQTNFQNDPNPCNPYRYAVLDGTPVDQNLVLEIAVPLSVKELVLASDGYPTVCNTLAESEQTLQHLLEVDPLCIKENAATKGFMRGNHSFDDRCYVRLAL